MTKLLARKNGNGYGPTQAGLVTNVVRKQGPLLEKSKLNTEEQLSWALSNLPTLTPASSVLDVHTGSGITAGALSNVAKSVEGIDLSRHLIAFAKARNSKQNLSFRIGRSEVLPYESNSFDIVVSRFGFQQLESPENSFNEMKRVCKPGGYIAVIERCPPAGLLERFRYKMEYLERIRDYTHIKFYDELSISILFELAGIRQRKITYSQAKEPLDDYLSLTNTLVPDRHLIETWVQGNIHTSEAELEQVTGFEPFSAEDTMWITHNLICVGGVKE